MPKKTSRKVRGAESQLDGGGDILKGWPGTGTARKIGDWVADTTPVKPIKVPEVGGRTVGGGRGNVYTPSGSFPGKDVFISKAPLSEKQIQGIMRGQLTKQDKYLTDIANKASRGAHYGLAVGAVGGVGATLATQKALDDARKAATGIGKAIKKARGGGTKKK